MNEIWFLKDAQRLALEQDAIRNLEENFNWLKGTNWFLDNCGKLCVEAIIHVHEHDYTVNMVYPALFPEVPPTVYPKNRVETWSTHQYMDGALCLQDLRNCHKQGRGYAAPSAKQLEDKHGNIRTFELLN